MNQDATSFEDLMSAGMQSSQEGDCARAVDCFERASAVQPHAGLPQFLLGAEFAAIGRIDDAEAAFANAVRLLPEFPMARYQLGLLQFSSGRAAIALLSWQPLLDLPDTDPLPHLVTGFAALAHDQFDDALRHFRHGLSLNHSNAALSGDIEKVIAGIEALQTPAGAKADSAPAADPDADAESRARALLDNYRSSDRLH
ncbi:MAG: hypothetical protein KKC85_00910 [Gammaproteobacteria bacterium]|nr:hypothetical protein [Gammaproteobacteria bacterium]MBU1441947.1 hypothetical protein [Gammaproteobacteria bacterium]MBU2284978.1 hypothetical protein [Gammaproteobacteria bacterium]